MLANRSIVPQLDKLPTELHAVIPAGPDRCLKELVEILRPAELIGARGEGRVLTVDGETGEHRLWNKSSLINNAAIDHPSLRCQIRRPGSQQIECEVLIANLFRLIQGFRVRL